MQGCSFFSQALFAPAAVLCCHTPAVLCRQAITVDLPLDTYVEVNTTFQPIELGVRPVCSSGSCTGGYKGTGALFRMPASDQCRILSYSDCPKPNFIDTIATALLGRFIFCAVYSEHTLVCVCVVGYILHSADWLL